MNSREFDALNLFDARQIDIDNGLMAGVLSGAEPVEAVLPAGMRDLWAKEFDESEDPRGARDKITAAMLIRGSSGMSVSAILNGWDSVAPFYGGSAKPAEVIKKLNPYKDLRGVSGKIDYSSVATGDIAAHKRNLQEQILRDLQGRETSDYMVRAATLRKGFWQSVKDGLDLAGMGMVENIGGVARSWGEAVNNRELADWGSVMSRAADEYIAEHPELQSGLRAEGFWGTLGQYIKHPEYVAQGFAESLPLMLGTTAATIATGGAGGALAGRFGASAAGVMRAGQIAGSVGGTAGAAGSVYGSYYNEARERGLTPGDASDYAFITSTVEGAIESWNVGWEIGLFKKAAFNEPKKRLAKLITGAAATGGKGFVRGGLEEGSQTLNSNFWGWVFEKGDEKLTAERLFKDVPSSAASGAVLEMFTAAPMDAGGGVSRYIGREKQHARVDAITGIAIENASEADRAQLEQYRDRLHEDVERGEWSPGQKNLSEADMKAKLDFANKVKEAWPDDSVTSEQIWDTIGLFELAAASEGLSWKEFYDKHIEDIAAAPRLVIGRFDADAAEGVAATIGDAFVEAGIDAVVNVSAEGQVDLEFNSEEDSARGAEIIASWNENAGEGTRQEAQEIREETGENGEVRFYLGAFGKEAPAKVEEISSKLAEAGIDGKVNRVDATGEVSVELIDPADREKAAALLGEGTGGGNATAENAEGAEIKTGEKNELINKKTPASQRVLLDKKAPNILSSEKKAALLDDIEAESIEEAEAKINSALDAVNKSEPVEITDYPKENLERKGFFKRALDLLYGKKVYNAELGADIEIRRSGLEHVKSNRGGIENAYPVLYIDKLLENAHLLGSEKNLDAKKKDVVRVHQFVSSFKVDTDSFYALITVLEDKEGHRYYDSASIKKNPSTTKTEGSEPSRVFYSAAEGLSFRTKSSILKLMMDSISRREANVKGKDGKILFQEEGVEPAGYINYLLGKLQSRILKNEVYKEAWTG